MPVGSGKTLTSFLAPRVMGSKAPLLLVPGSLVDKTHAEWDEYNKDWALWQKPHIVSYEWLSHPNRKDLASYGEFDLVVCDEADRLRNIKSAACARKLAEFWRDHEPKFLFMSGTLWARSLMDAWHLFLMALGGENSPLPRTKLTAETWARAADMKPQPYREAPGALLEWAEGTDVDAIREGVRKRIAQTPGVVAPPMEPDCGADIVIRVHTDGGTDELELLIHQAKHGLHPTGEPIMFATDQWQTIQELSQGFYYTWVEEPPKWWLNIRAGYHRFVSDKLQRRYKGINSPSQVEERWNMEPAIVEWSQAQEDFQPETEPVFVADFPSILPPELLDLWGDDTVLHWAEHRAITEQYPNTCSRPKLYRGHNLQHYSRNVIYCPPSSGTIWQQLMGRTHRYGQEADRVEFDVWAWTEQARNNLTKACLGARFVKGVSGEPQKLLDATWLTGKEIRDGSF